MSLKPKEFTAARPLVVSIHRHDGEWSIHAHADHKEKMEERLKARDPKGVSLEDSILEKWMRRRAAKAPAAPHFKEHAHTPVIAREGEFLKFECDPKFGFAVWVDRDPEVCTEPRAPNNPLVGWKFPMTVSPGQGLIAEIKGKDAAGVGPANQAFYKVIAWVFDPEARETITVDPDLYIEGDP